MKSSILLLTNCLLLIIFLSLFGEYFLNKSWNKGESNQESIVNQTNTNQSKIDYMNTVKANTLILQKDSIISSLKTRIKNEKARTKAQQLIAKKQHFVNDSLYALYENERSIVHCDELISSLGSEVIKKDTLIDCLVAEIESYDREGKALEGKVILQKRIIESKENLILYKDSTITFYKKQKKESDFWSDVKLKAAIGMILFETMALLLK
jgi:hypothetical protein